MRVLVTGGAGYIGSHTAKALAEQGIEPIVFDNLSLGHTEAVRWGPLVRGDLSEPQSIRRALSNHRIEAVIHFAAYAYVGESVQQPRRYFENNVVNSLRLLDAMLNEGVKRIVFSSTCATYGLPERVPIREDHPQRPVSPYGEAKLFVERAIQWYELAYGLRWVALRYFNAAGADPDGEIGEVHTPETHLIPLTAQAALGGVPLRIFGTDFPTRDGTAVRDYIHVTDLADAHLKALRYLDAGGQNGAFNLGTGRGYSVREVVDAVSRISQATVPVIEAPRRSGDPPELVADASLAKAALGWECRNSDLDTICRTALDWQSRMGRSHSR